jgi:hypothetical protein
MKDISKMTLEELKALGYDQIVEQSRIQQNLQLINTEIAKRAEKSSGSVVSK